MQKSSHSEIFASYFILIKYLLKLHLSIYRGYMYLFMCNIWECAFIFILVANLEPIKSVFFFLFVQIFVNLFMSSLFWKNWLANLLLFLQLFLLKSGSNVAYNDDDNGFGVSFGRGFDLRFVFVLRFGCVARPVFTFNGLDSAPDLERWICRLIENSFN